MDYCTTDITFYSTDKRAVDRMHKEFFEIFTRCVDSASGYPYRIDFEKNYFPEHTDSTPRARGLITYVSDDASQREQYWYFTMSTETDYVAGIGLWNAIVKKHFPTIDIAYIAYETTWENYHKWDKTDNEIFFPEKYYLDYCLPAEGGGERYADNNLYVSLDDIEDELASTWLGRQLREDVRTSTADIDTAVRELSLNCFVDFGEFIEVAPETFELDE